MGTGATIVPGEVQRMSAGTGVTHSEFNHRQDEVTHFLQIWIIPKRLGVKPNYQQRAFSAEEKRGKLRLLISPDGENGSLDINQDARMYAGLFDGDEQAQLELSSERLGYVHLARGEASVNGRALSAGDALLYGDEPMIEISAGKDAEILVFDLPSTP